MHEAARMHVPDAREQAGAHLAGARVRKAAGGARTLNNLVQVFWQELEDKVEIFGLLVEDQFAQVDEVWMLAERL